MAASEANLSLLKTGARGRKDGGQEQVIRVQAVKDKIEHLVKLHAAHEEAAENLSDAIKAVAEKGGIEASVLKRFVAARAGEKFDRARKRSEQLELLFDQIGE